MVACMQFTMIGVRGGWVSLEGGCPWRVGVPKRQMSMEGGCP